MLKKIDAPKPDITVFEIQGNLSKQDCTDTIIPSILKARSIGEKLK